MDVDIVSFFNPFELCEINKSFSTKWDSSSMFVLQSYRWWYTKSFGIYSNLCLIYWFLVSLEEDFLRYCSVAVKCHHGQCNLQKKAFNLWACLQFQRVTVTIMAGFIMACMNGAGAVAENWLTIHKQEKEWEKLGPGRTFETKWHNSSNRGHIS